MDRWTAVSALVRGRVIGIIRSPDRAAAAEVGSALLDAGMPAIEISLTTPGGLDAVSDLASARGDGRLVGAGTVLDPETARLAIMAGARFLVAPNLSRPVIEMAHRYGIPVIPGAATPTEIVGALEVGADLVKFFPASELGIGSLRAVRAALPQAPLVPTGGVTAATAGEWLATGAVAVAVGGALSRGSAAEVQSAARALLAAVRTDHG
jgi:2-dehydro-3-deoxyphosphogluconate aldolase / (4S)-4-hydroxy-2-oxoglutarate aldolase